MAKNPKTSRVDELLGQADAMLGLPPGIWRGTPFSSDWRQNISDAAAAVRQAEYDFCAALASRLNVMVHRQAMDRQAWDFIAAMRDQLRLRLAKDLCPLWVEAGFSQDPSHIPERLEDRIKLLADICAFLRRYPEYRDPSRGIVNTRAQQLKNNLMTALSRVEQCRRDLRRQVQRRHRAVKHLYSVLHAATLEVQRILRQKDPRWLFLGPVVPTKPPPVGAEALDASRPLSGINTAPPPRPACSPLVAPGRFTSALSRNPLVRTESGRKQLHLEELKLLSLLAWFFPPVN